MTFNFNKLFYKTFDKNMNCCEKKKINNYYCISTILGTVGT